MGRLQRDRPGQPRPARPSMRSIRKSASARRRPEYLRMLAGIFVAYVLIIGFGDTHFEGPVRIGLLGFLLWSSSRLHSDHRLRRWALGVAAAGLVATLVVALTAPYLVVYGVVGALSTLLLTFAIAAIVSTLIQKLRVETATVLGVLCIY